MKIKKNSELKVKKQKTEGMTSASPWNIKGVPLEVRNAVQMAAKRNNEFIGSWVARKLMQCAQEDLTGKQEIATQEDINLALFEEIKKLSQKIDQLPQKKPLFGFFRKT
jgi:hypothetical protein